MSYVFYALSALISVLFGFHFGWFDSLHALWQLPLCFIASFAALLILYSLLLLVSTRFINRNHVYKKPDAFFRFLINETVQIAFHFAGVHVHTTGLEKIPKNTRYMLVSNHLFAFDPAVFFYAMPNEQFSFISKKENYNLFLIPELMHATMCLPIDRENDRAALRTILKAISYLKEDRTSIAVFPEGGTSKTGELQPMRNGVFKIAQKAEVPIVVCTIRNTRAILSNMFRRKTDVYLDVHAVLPAQEIVHATTAEIGETVHKIMADGIAARAIGA